VTDNELIAKVSAALLARLAATSYSLAYVGLLQNFQPTQQGVPSTPCLFLHKIVDVRVGFPQRKEQWNETAQQFDYVESEQLETTYQFTARAPQNPADDTELTAGDYLKAAARALQSDPVIISLRQSAVGVLRIGTIRGGFAIGDTGDFQEEPSFDVVFTHRNSTIDTLPAVVSEEIIINRV
jgi:hypothetical protein